jgi:hypothetical protein
MIIIINYDKQVTMFFNKLFMDSYGVEHLFKMSHHTMHSPINVLNLWVKLEGCRKHDISTIVIVLWFSLNFPITYFVSSFTSISNRIGRFVLVTVVTYKDC